jgi:hypothetical protein
VSLCTAQGQAEVLLVEDFSELRGRRFLGIRSQHFHRPCHGVAGAQSAGQHVNGLGKN